MFHSRAAYSVSRKLFYLTALPLDTIDRLIDFYKIHVGGHCNSIDYLIYKKNSVAIKDFFLQGEEKNSIIQRERERGGLMAVYCILCRNTADKRKSK